MGNIENMRRRPAIKSLANISRGPLLTGNLDRIGDEALLDPVVDLRKTHHRNVHTAFRHGSTGDLRQSARIWMVGIEIVFGCGLTWNGVPHSGSGSNYQGAVRSPERISESFDGPPVLFTNLRELREVASECAVIESAMNYPIRLVCSVAQTFRVFKTSSMHLGSRGDKRLGAGVGPRQSEHLMTRIDELGNDGRSDKASSPRKKYTHTVFPFHS